MGVKRRFDSQNSQNQNKLSKALAMGNNETIKVAHRRSDFPKIMNKKLRNFFPGLSSCFASLFNGIRLRPSNSESTWNICV